MKKSTCAILKVLSILPALLLFLTSHAAWQVHPQAKIHQRPASKSRMLWNKDQKVADHAISYFRYEFDVPERVRSGIFRIYFDDAGEVFLNGKKLHPSKIPSQLKPGKNLLAFKNVNVYAYAGIIFYGEMTLKSGKKFYLHSVPDIKSSASAAPGWEKPGFDDSKWKSSLDQGDVLSMPWARHHKMVQLFASPEESARIANEIKNSTALAPEVLKTPPPQAKIVYQGNQPKISIGGKIYDPVFALVEGDDEYNRSFVARVAETGVKLFHVYHSDEHAYLGKDKGFDFENLDTKIRRMLHLVPDGQLELNIIFGRSSRWCKENPGEIIQFATGPVETRGKLRDERTGRPERPSPASDKYREYVRNTLHALCKYIKTKPWNNRIFSIRLSFGVYTEWHYYGYHQGPDSSEVMVKKFRAWLKNKYKNVSALRQAWNDDKVSFETAAAPSWKERNAPGFILDPLKSRKSIDFYNCLAEVNADLLLGMAGQIKKELPGRLCGAYYGYVFATQPPEGANVLIDKVIGSPLIDFASDPATYTPEVRRAGGSFTHRAVPSTHRRYGKLSIIEDDTRYHHLLQYYGPSEKKYAAQTEVEARMVTRRNFCNMLFNGSGLQINDASPQIGRRPHTFDHPAVLESIRESLAVLKKAGTPADTSGNACALVIDYRERFRRSGRTGEGSRQNYWTYEVLQSIYRSGIPFDSITLQDFLASGQKYSHVIFLNLYSPDPSERKAILKKVRTPGVTAFWLTAPGSVTEKGFSDSAMSELAGIKLAGSGVMPKVRCLEKDVKKLPAGAVSKTLPDQSVSVFVPNVPRTGEQWHALLKAVGVHAYAAPGSYLRRHGNLLMFHTGTKGAHTLTLPEKSGTLTELFSGRKYNAPVIKLAADDAQTWLFKLQ